MGKGLRVTLVGMGLFFVILGISLNFQLYISLAGDSTLYKTSYGLIGIGLDISKVLCLMLGVFLVVQNNTTAIIFGILSIVFWLVLSGISLSAGWGFSLIVAQQYESKGMQNNIQLKSAQASVDNAQAKLDSASQYASVNIMALTTSKQGLENSLTTLENTLNKCPKGWKSKCIDPTMAKIETVNRELKQILIQLNGHQSYLSALVHKENAVKQLANLDVSQLNTDSYIHPLFLGLSKMFDIDAETAKYRLLLVTFISIEWLGTLFLSVGSFFSNKREFTFADFEMFEKKRDELKRVYGYQVKKTDTDTDIELITQEQVRNKQGMLEEQGMNEERKQWTVNELVKYITNSCTQKTWTIRELTSTFNIGNGKAQEVRNLLIQRNGDNI